jgi:hypothetical protein
MLYVKLLKAKLIFNMSVPTAKQTLHFTATSINFVMLFNDIISAKLFFWTLSIV